MIVDWTLKSDDDYAVIMMAILLQVAITVLI